MNSQYRDTLSTQSSDMFLSLEENESYSLNTTSEVYHFEDFDPEDLINVLAYLVMSIGESEEK